MILLMACIPFYLFLLDMSMNFINFKLPCWRKTSGHLCNYTNSPSMENWDPAMNHVPAQREKSHPIISHPSPFLLCKMFPSTPETRKEVVSKKDECISLLIRSLPPGSQQYEESQWWGPAQSSNQMVSTPTYTCLDFG